MNATQQIAARCYPTTAHFTASFEGAKSYPVGVYTVFIGTWRCGKHGFVYGANGRFVGMTGACRNVAAAQAAAARLVSRTARAAA